MEFFELTKAQGLEYMAHVIARHEFRLQQLASWMRATGGPIAVMDGSYDSLEPLWVWIMRQVDEHVTQVPDDARSSQSIALGDEADSDDRLRYFGETLDHYLFEIYRCTYPDVTWALLDKGRAKYEDPLNFSTGAVVFQRKVSNIFGRIAGGVFAYRNGRVGVEAPERLFQSIQGIIDGRGPSGAPPGPSILTSRPAPPAEGWGAAALIPPVFIQQAAGDTQTIADDTEAWAESELIFAGIGADIDELERSKPLNADAVAGALAQLNFLNYDGVVVTSADLLVDGFESTHGDGAVISTLVSRGKLRALSLELLHVDAPFERTVIASLEQLGSKLRARLATSDLWALTTDAGNE